MFSEWHHRVMVLPVSAINGAAAPLAITLPPGVREVAWKVEISRTTDFELIARLNETVHNLHVDLYPDEFVPYDYAAMCEAFRQLITDDRFLFLTVSEAGETHGYAWIEFIDTPANAFRQPHTSLMVHQLSIEDGFQRRGYGSALMNHIHCIAKDNGTERVELDYWAQNEAARDFYRKQGFAPYREFVYRQV